MVWSCAACCSIKGAWQSPASPHFVHGEFLACEFHTGFLMVSLWISTQTPSSSGAFGGLGRLLLRPGPTLLAYYINIASTSSSIFQTSMPKVSKSCIKRQKTWPSWPCNWLYSNCMIDLYDLYGPFVSKSLRCLHVSRCLQCLDGRRRPQVETFNTAFMQLMCLQYRLADVRANYCFRPWCVLDIFDTRGLLTIFFGPLCDSKVRTDRPGLLSLDCYPWSWDVVVDLPQTLELCRSGTQFPALGQVDSIDQCIKVFIIYKYSNIYIYIDIDIDII